MKQNINLYNMAHIQGGPKVGLQLKVDLSQNYRLTLPMQKLKLCYFFSFNQMIVYKFLHEKRK